MSDYDDRTVDELQDELRDRDLKVSGTKDELIARLEDDDASSGEDDADTDRAGDGGGDDDGSDGGSDDGTGGGDDRSGDGPGAGEGPGGDGEAGVGSSGPGLAGVVGRIREELGAVLGLEVERVTGLSREDGGWHAQADVVEISRVPPSTDVLATYDVTTDGEGHLDGFDRVRRFRRSEGFSA